MTSEGLTIEEEKQFIKLTEKLTGQVTKDLYNALASKFAFTAIEVVTLRVHEGKLEVLLTKRDSDDIFANGWHSPGSILRASDAPEKYDTVGDYQSAFKRVEQEIKVPFSVVPKFVGIILQRHLRGVDNGIVFISEIAEAPGKGQFFPVDAIPEPFLEHQRAIIAMAVEGWKKIRI